MTETIVLELVRVFLLLFIIIFIMDRFSLPKSKKYREDLSNMYVAGKIRKIAEGDEIDLNKEFLEFAKITKNKRINVEALDTTVERELQEKLAENRASKLNTKE